MQRARRLASSLAKRVETLRGAALSARSVARFERRRVEANVFWAGPVIKRVHAKYAAHGVTRRQQARGLGAVELVE